MNITVKTVKTVEYSIEHITCEINIQTGQIKIPGMWLDAADESTEKILKEFSQLCNFLKFSFDILNSSEDESPERIVAYGLKRLSLLGDIVTSLNMQMQEILEFIQNNLSIINQRKNFEFISKHELMQQRRSHFSKERSILLLQLIQRDGEKCFICADRGNLTIDHKIPLSRGGDDSLDNLQILCKGCNSSKNDYL